MFGGSVVGGTFPDRAGVPGFLVLKSFQVFHDDFSMWVTRAGTQRPRQLAPGVNIATQHLFLVKVESELERIFVL